MSHAFSGVSMEHPFGNTSMGDDVSTQHPFGDSGAAQLGNTINQFTGGLLGKAGISPQAQAILSGGEFGGGWGNNAAGDWARNVGLLGGLISSPTAAITPSAGNPPASSQAGTNPQPSSIDTSGEAPSLTSLTPSENTSQEDALRASYQNSLQPNYGFTYNGQSSPGGFSSVPGAKGSATIGGR